MAKQEAPQFFSSFRCTECTAVQRAISSERNLETSLVTLPYWANEKILTLQQVEKVETYFYDKLIPGTTS